MTSGIFVAPFHPVDEVPTMAIRRDTEMVEWLDELGFDEAWIGEHQLAGYEIIRSGKRMGAAMLAAMGMMRELRKETEARAARSRKPAA